MKGEQLKELWKHFKIGFWKRLTICSVLFLSVNLFNLFGDSFLKLIALLTTFVSAELFVDCYVPFFVSQIGLLFRNKATERPIPDEVATLARTMGVRLEKMKVVPKLCNAFARGGQVFLGEELLKKLDFEQIKAVLAHEFGHIRGKHAIIQMFYTLPIIVSLCLSWYNLPPVMISLGAFAYMTIALVPLQWVLERKADLVAARYIGKEAMKSALLALDETSKLDEPSETHPPIGKRLKWIDEAKLN